jgi:mRNA interferase MazF
MGTIKRGEVYCVKPDPSVGKEILKNRPCVVVSSDIVNDNAGIIVVCPITEGIHLEENIIHIAVAKGEGGTTKDSIVLCEQIKAVDDGRLMEKKGNLLSGTMQKIDKGLREILLLH